MNEANTASRQRQKKLKAGVSPEVASVPGPAAIPMSLERIKARCRVDGDCWLWLGPVKGGGYPIINKNRKVQTAARLSLSLALGREVRAGFVARPSCGNRLCVSPLCCKEVSRKALARETALKVQGQCRPPSTRQRNREKLMRQGWAKLDMERATQIRERRGESTAVELALEFGVTRDCIVRIWRGATWADLAKTEAPNSSVFAWRPAA